jgi:hypothetical protein
MPAHALAYYGWRKPTAQTGWRRPDSGHCCWAHYGTKVLSRFSSTVSISNPAHLKSNHLYPMTTTISVTPLITTNPKGTNDVTSPYTGKAQCTEVRRDARCTDGTALAE